MTDADKKFMTDMGIEPCTLDDPFPNSLLEQEPEQGFVLPKSLWDYLVRFPNGIREATESTARELGLVPLDGGLDAWAEGVTDMFVRFEEAGLEDVVAMFPLLRPRQYGSEQFQEYMKARVTWALPALLRNTAA